MRHVFGDDFAQSILAEKDDMVEAFPLDRLQKHSALPFIIGMWIGRRQGIVPALRRRFQNLPMASDRHKRRPSDVHRINNKSLTQSSKRELLPHQELGVDSRFPRFVQSHHT